MEFWIGHCSLWYLYLLYISSFSSFFKKTNNNGQPGNTELRHVHGFHILLPFFIDFFPKFNELFHWLFHLIFLLSFLCVSVMTFTYWLDPPITFFSDGIRMKSPLSFLSFILHSFKIYWGKSLNCVLIFNLHFITFGLMLMQNEIWKNNIFLVLEIFLCVKFYFYKRIKTISRSKSAAFENFRSTRMKL